MNKIDVVNKFKCAQDCYVKANELFETNKYADCIDKLHDCVENYAKALLSKNNISYPPKHNLSELLAKFYNHYSEEGVYCTAYKYKVLPPLISTHIIFASIRNITRYGFMSIPTEQLYNKNMVEGFFKIVDSFRPFINTWLST